MQKIVYCYDENTKNRLSKKGFKYYEKQDGDKTVWLFEETEELLNILKRKNKNTQYVSSSQMYF